MTGVLKRSREEPPHIRGQGQKPGPIPEGRRPRGVTPRPRSGAVAKSTRLRQQERPRGVTSCPRSGATAQRSYPTPPGPGPRAVAGRSNPMPEARGGGREDQPHAKGKRNPSKTVGVARGHQRANTLKPYSQKTSQSNHTRTT